MFTLGIDVSSWEKPLNWAVAADRGIRWASIRATAGLNQDAAYLQHLDDAGHAGIKHIPYHWYIPRKSPQLQAQAFLKALASRPLPELPAMLDLENYGTSAVAYAGIAKAELLPWLNLVEKATGQRPVIYTTPNYIALYLTNETWLSQYPLFIANWKVPAPSVPRPWTPGNWWAWQYTNVADGAYYGLIGTKSASLAIRPDA